MEENEKEIIRQLKEGKETAYRYLFEHHFAVMCAIAVEYLHDDFLAETIVSDMFFHVWEIRKTLEIQTSLRSYLAQGVRHRCLDWLKQKRLKHELPGDERTAAIVDMKPDSDHPLASLLDKELEGAIDDAVKSLPDDTRRVFCMSRFDGKKNKEIAESLGISVNTVKYHLKQALKLLRAALRQYVEIFFLIAMLE